MATCDFCNNDSFKVTYHGKIRNGKFGSFYPEDVKITSCTMCHVEKLDLPSLPEDYYTSEQYRNEVNGQSDPNHYYQLHDSEQIRNFNAFGTSIFRNKIVADVGTGAASFLDYISTVAAKTIAIEPAEHFQKTLIEKKHEVFSFCSDALKVYENQLDLVTSFSVIEHIPEAKKFLEEIYQLLKPGGCMLLSTPNNNDILKTFLGDQYKSFYYRKVHHWYFDEISLRFILESIGFKNIEFTYLQRFGLDNFLNWTNHKAPMGDSPVEFVDNIQNELWKKSLENKKVSDYLYIKAEK